ncbi:MAG: hypothetical protein WC446_01210 [Candidatus Paceibacterota bacterium]|jgi:hypothetical protein
MEKNQSKNKIESIKNIIGERKKEIIVVALLAMALVILLFFVNKSQEIGTKEEDRGQREIDTIVQMEIDSINQLRQTASAKETTEEDMQSQLEDIIEKKQDISPVVNIDEEIKKQMESIERLRNKK